MKLLITGASGFIGSRLLQLLEAEQSLEHIYILGHRNCHFAINRTHTVINVQSLSELRDQNIDYFVHLAQDRNYRDFPARANEIFDSNVRLTQHVLDLALKCKARHFFYLSSGSVYDLTKSPITEESLTAINDYYAFTKIASEQLIRTYANCFETTILRLFNPYGPNLGEKFLARVMRQIKNDKPILVNPENDFKFNPIYLDDVCKIIISTLHHQASGTYNLGGPEVISFTEIAKSIAHLLNKDLILQESSAANKLDMIAMPEKLMQKIDYHFETRLEDGLRVFINTNG